MHWTARLRRRTVANALLLLVVLMPASSAQESFQFCYDNNGSPLRCEPPARSFSFGIPPEVNSTCGDPPEDFCETRVLLGEPYSFCDSFICDNSSSTLSHRAELMTDSYPRSDPTWWQSKNGDERVAIRMNLGILVQIQAIVMQFYSLKPHSFYIQKSTDFGATYTPFHYFSQTCLSTYNITPEADLTLDNETEVLCQQITSINTGQISFVPDLNRPSANDSIPGLSNALYEFVSATNITILLDNQTILPDLNNLSYHYAIRDINIVGKCDCNGHANVCENNSPISCVCQHNTTGVHCERCKTTHNDLPWQITNGDGPFECKACQCNGHATECTFDSELYAASGMTSGGRCLNCTDNTAGPHCESCVEFYFPPDEEPANSSNRCQSCNCSITGIIDSGDCTKQSSANASVGQCNCKANIMGQTCDQCKPGFFNLQPDNVDGCSDCGCHEILSDTNECDNEGVCTCKPNVVGMKCDQCRPLHYLANQTGLTGCTACNCNVGGSTDLQCNNVTGACSCLPNVAGDKCDQCPTSTFNFTAGVGCQACDCHVAGSNGSECDLVTGQCMCNTGYAGLKCGSCDFGFFGPECNECGCSENGSLTQDCHDNGTCSCVVGTTGIKCTECIDGYYKDEQSGNCIACGCNLAGVSDSGSCTAQTTGGVTIRQCNCKANVVGGACDTCVASFFNLQADNTDGCEVCNCHSNLSTSSECNQTTGACSCEQNVVGLKCDRCAPNHYEFGNDGCSACECGLSGSVDLQCNGSGVCSCLPNVVGDKCNQCAPNTFNITAGVGCQTCDCHVTGSSGPECDLATGQCVCKMGVTGRRCDECAFGFYGLSEEGCSECACSGSGLVSRDCHDNGTCICVVGTTGPNCTECSDGYYRDEQSGNCTACGCNLAGVSDSGSCTAQTTGGVTVRQCNCKANVAGGACDTCVASFFNLQADNTDGCEACNCHSNLSTSNECNQTTGACSCEQNVVGLKCERCAPNHYINSSTCSPCNCNLGGSLSQECNYLTGQCPCREGVSARDCSQTSPGYYFPFVDHQLFEAEESNGIFNISYRRPEPVNQLFTGRGHALINNDVDLINFGEFTPPTSGIYKLTVRYDLLNALMWNQAELRIAVGSQDGDGAPSSCAEYTGEQVIFNSLAMGTAQVSLVELCLRGGRVYDLTLNGFLSGDSTGQAELLVDSLVIFLEDTPHLLTLSSPEMRSSYVSCVNNFMSIMTRTDHIVMECERASFAVFTELYNGTRLCECDPIGSTGSTCQQYGGQCSCKANVMGRQCNQCVAGAHSLSSTGCRDCGCNVNGSENEFCNILGQCSCHPGVSDLDCGSCADGYFNFVAGVGCTECACNTNASISNVCNDVGVCPCQSGVGGDKCDSCLPEHFNYPECRECGCDAAGSTSLDCDLSSGQCPCKSNTQGIHCSICKPNTINNQQGNPDGCQSCFCSEMSTSCSSASGFVSSNVVSDFASSGSLMDWELTGASSFQLTPQGLVINSIVTSSIDAPSPFLGNKLSSYSQNIIITAIINGPSQSDSHDVLLQGDGLTIVSNFSFLLSNELQNISVHLHESAGWRSMATGSPVMDADLQAVLLDLTRLSIRVSLSDTITLSSIALESTAPASGGEDEVSWVENCTCPLNYTGLSCEQCADGYFRDSVSKLCVSCECNGLSSLCDKQTGVCINCSGNTIGDECEECAEGFYGDPTQSMTCQACPCPGTSGVERFADSCVLDEATIMCDCHEGHIGNQCEMCAPGYFGNPNGTASGPILGCSNCSCSGNIDTSDPTSCDHQTGECLKCLFNTTGSQCRECLPNFYGDPIIAKNCRACECSLSGSADLQCNGSGVCSCLPNVVGNKCDQCAPNTFNFTAGVGCQACDCHVTGSSGPQCDLMTGQCVCKTGVTGRRCDECAFGFYKLSEEGCRDCQCEESVTPQCMENGDCICNEGFIGSKCDKCRVNYYNNTMTGKCTMCPSCYSQLQVEVDSTIAYLNSTALRVNVVAENNDPDSSFAEKRRKSFILLNSLQNATAELIAEHGNLNDLVANFSINVSATVSSMANLNARITQSGEVASPVVGLTAVSDEIRMIIIRNVMASTEAFTHINNIILPSVQGNLSIILSNEESANSSKNDLIAHVSQLQEDLVQIMVISSQVANLSLAASNTAAILVPLYESNLARLSSLQMMTEEQQNNVDALKLTLQMMEILIMEKESKLQQIRDNIPSPPSESAITDLRDENDRLSNQVKSISEQVSTLSENITALKMTLQQQETGVALAEAQLSNLTTIINRLSSMVQANLSNSQQSSITANDCLTNAKRVLDILQNYNESVAELREQADLAIEAAELANSTSEAVEMRVAEIMQQLQKAVTSLGNASSLATLSKNNSQATLQKVARLNSSSSSLLFSAPLSSVMNDLKDIQAIQNKTNMLLLQLQALDNMVSDITNRVGTIEGLPSIVWALVRNISEAVNNLRLKLEMAQSSDSNEVFDVQSYVDTVSEGFNSSSISETIERLESELVELQSQESNLQAEYDELREEVDKLREIAAMLPEGCEEGVGGLGSGLDSDIDSSGSGLLRN